MNSFIIGFLSSQKIIQIIVSFLIPVGFLVLFVWLLVALIRFLNRNGKPKWFAKELENQFNRYQDSLFTQKDIRDYYPVKEGNKITLIRFDEIVDFSAANNYIFLTDISGKDYLVESNLTDLETWYANTQSSRTGYQSAA